MMARLGGTIKAAPTPWTTRLPIRLAGFGAKAQAIDAKANRTIPAANTLRRPSLSPIAPPASSNEPNMSVYPLTTHCRSENVACREVCIAGNAIYASVPSINAIAEAKMVATRTMVRLRSGHGVSQGRSRASLPLGQSGLCVMLILGSHYRPGDVLRHLHSIRQRRAVQWAVRVLLILIDFRTVACGQDSRRLSHGCLIDADSGPVRSAPVSDIGINETDFGYIQSARRERDQDPRRVTRKPCGPDEKIRMSLEGCAAIDH